MPHTLKSNLHKSFETGLTASTTQTQGEGALTAEVNEIATVANASDTVTLPAVSEGFEAVVINAGANDLQIFPASGDDLGNGTDVSLILEAGTEKNFLGIDDTTWVNYGSSDAASASPAAYGAMYEDNSGGSGISATTSYVGWTSATAGVFDGDSLVVFTGNGTADRLTVGTDGAGVYMVGFHANFTNSGGKNTTAAIHVNGVEQTGVKMLAPGDSSKAAHISSSDIITLADGDYVDLRFKSEDSDTVTVFQVNVNISRIET